MGFKILTFGFGHTPSDNLVSLRRKVNRYYKLFPLKRKMYISELAFLNSEAKEQADYSFIFPYKFVYRYSYDDIQVFKDELLNLFYVLHNGKRLYYSRDYKTELDVKKGYYTISVEQDKSSPHKYTNATFDIQENDVIIDIGGAEGNFSLDIVEKAGELYIFETEEGWMEALNATFKPWKDKVHIINKYVSDKDDRNCISLDHFFSQKQIDFIKIDVEGAEEKILNGATKTLSNNNSLKMAICTYHKGKDAMNLAQILSRQGYNHSFTNGYMLFVYSYLTPPYFRKGLIRAQKEEFKQND